MFWDYSVLSKSKTVAGPAKQKGGFGLVELMVSISIMVIVSAIILGRQASFNGSVLLRSQAYEIALHVREIQLNAVSASSDGVGGFRSVLGLHFDTGTLNNGVYHVFRDADDDGYYDADEAFGLQGILDKRFEIREIRIMAAIPYTVPDLSVVFVRPNFDARFFDSSGELLVPSVEIDVGRRGFSGTDSIRTVEITSTGQIAVQ